MKRIVALLSLLAVALGAVAQGESVIPHIVPESKDVKIAFLTDIHAFHHGREVEKYLPVAIREINNSDCDFVLLGGDNVSTGYEKDIVNTYEMLKGIEKPWFGVLGNHEVIRTDNANRLYKKLFGYDHRVVLRAGEYLFVGFEAGPYNRASTAIVRDEDIKWLEEQFKSARPGEKIICVSHIPLNHHIANHREVTDLMKKYDVKAQICGHAHYTLMLNIDYLPCAMGRSFGLVDKKWGFGYNIIELKNDSIYLHQKRLDHSQPRLRFKERQGYSPDLPTKRYKPAPIVPNTYKEIGAVLFKDLRPAVYAGALVREGAAYVGHSNGTFYAFDTATGAERWRYEMGDMLCATPVWHDGKVIFVTPAGEFIALNAKTGKVVWKLQADGSVVGDPVVVGDMLYCSFGKGILAKIDARTGAVVWRAAAGSMHMQCVPAVGEGRVVVSTWENDLRCYNDKNGKEMWRWVQSDRWFDFSPGLIQPQIANGKVYASINKELAALSLKSGRLLWRDTSVSYRKASGRGSDGKSLYFQNRDADIIAIDPSKKALSTIWQAETPKVKVDRNPIQIAVINGVIYKGAKGGWIIAVEEKSGKLLWEHKFTDVEANNICADENGVVWAMFLDGKLFRLN